MKKGLIDLLQENSFIEKALKSEILKDCNGLLLQRDWSQETEVVWHGKMAVTLSVIVFINRNSGICHVSFFKDGREFKDRWYDTIGKRTYNAIVETVKNAEFEM